MSFLLKRSPDLAWAGFLDSFDRPPESPAARPWVHLGDGTQADINPLYELHIPSNYNTANGGGPSYEFQPFTASWGFDATFWYPVNGVASQGFSFFITDSWARVGAKFQNVIGVRLIHQTPAAGGDILQIGQLATPVSAVTNRGQWASPVTFDGTTLSLRVWVDDDQFVRVWLNGTFVGFAVVTPDYRTGPDRRCIRILNSALCDVWLRDLFAYDRRPDAPLDAAWSSTFYDSFDRANGPVANGWTEIGSNSAARIVGNSWAINGTADGTRGILRDSGITTGAQRIEGTIGGANPPDGTRSAALVVRGNQAGTTGLCVNVFAGALYLAKFTTSLASTPAMTDYAAITNYTVAAGDHVILSTRDGWAWVEVNDRVVLAVPDIDSKVPAAQSWCGAKVERKQFFNSGSWNDLRIYGAA